LDEDDSDFSYTSAEEILDIFKRLSNDIIAKVGTDNTDQKLSSKATESIDSQSAESGNDNNEFQTRIRIYDFETLDQVSRLSVLLPEDLSCESVLYKNPRTKHFFLVLSSEGHSLTSFEAICHLASEFGRCEKASVNTLYYYDEHYETIIRKNALQVLRNL
jgi:adapter protein MecA 1/2